MCLVLSAHLIVNAVWIRLRDNINLVEKNDLFGNTSDKDNVWKQSNTVRIERAVSLFLLFLKRRYIFTSRSSNLPKVKFFAMQCALKQKLRFINIALTDNKAKKRAEIEYDSYTFCSLVLALRRSFSFLTLFTFWR